MTQGESDRSSKVKTLLTFIIFLAAVTWLSLEIQEIHQGWGYTFGLAGLLIGFFWAIHDLTSDRR
jgi:fatty acid desaturase